MGNSGPKPLIKDTDLYVNTHGDKYAQMWGITGGFVGTWFIVGIGLSIYVYSQISPKEAKMRSSHSM